MKKIFFALLMTSAFYGKNIHAVHKPIVQDNCRLNVDGLLLEGNLGSGVLVYSPDQPVVFTVAPECGSSPTDPLIRWVHQYYVDGEPHGGIVQESGSSLTITNTGEYAGRSTHHITVQNIAGGIVDASIGFGIKPATPTLEIDSCVYDPVLNQSFGHVKILGADPEPGEPYSEQPFQFILRNNENGTIGDYNLHINNANGYEGDLRLISGVYKVYSDKPYGGIGPRLGDYSTRSDESNAVTVSCSGPTYDFALTNVDVGQATYSSTAQNSGKFDLIKGKNVVIQALIEKRLPIASNDNTPIGVRAVLSNASGSKNFYGQFLAKQLSTDNSILVNLTSPDTFDLSGDGNIEVIVNPTNNLDGLPAHVNEPQMGDNDNSASNTGVTGFKQFRSYSPKKLDIDLVPIDPECGNQPFCPQAIQDSDVDITRDKTTKFIQAAFPVSADSLSVVKRDALTKDAAVRKTFSNGTIEQDAEVRDLVTLNTIGIRLRNLLLPGYERRVGIVKSHLDDENPGYFKYHGYNDVEPGAPFAIHSENTSSVFIIEEGLPVGIAWRLAKSFNISYPCERGSCDYFPETGPQAGFWTGPTGDSNFGPKNLRSFATQSLPRLAASELDLRWIDGVTYDSLFKKLTSSFFPYKKKVMVSPERIYVGGVISSDGQINVMNSLVTQSLDDLPNSGDGKVKLKNPMGEVISEYAFANSNRLEVITSETAGSHFVISTQTPISIEVPFENSVQELEISSRGKVLHLQPHSSLIDQAVSSIPDRGFSDNPIGKRNELKQMALAFSSSFKEKNYQKAFVNLRYTLRPAVESMVIDFANKTALEFSREEVLAVIDSILPKENALKAFVPNPKNSFLEIQLDKDAYMAGERSNAQVKAINKPTNPAVEIGIEVKLDEVVWRVNGSQEQNWLSTTSALAHGMHTWSFTPFIQNKREAKVYLDSIFQLEKERFDLQRELSQESDPAKIAEIQQKILSVDQKIVFLKQELASIRRKISEAIEVPLWVE